jgi:hypothetical protein
MTSQTVQDFTAAASLFSWYKKNADTDFVLNELNKDLRKWKTPVKAHLNIEHASCVIDARFGNTVYSLTVSIHAELCTPCITPEQVPEEYRRLLKTHTRARNVLKNFMPVVFDTVSADGQLKLLQIGLHPEGPVSYSTWSTNVSGIGISFTTFIEEDEKTNFEKEKPSWITNVLMKPLLNQPTNQES